MTQSQTEDSIVLKTVEKLLEEVPQPSVVQLTTATMMDMPPPLRVFLYHEISRFSILLTKMASTLGNLRAAINGDVLMSTILESLHRAVLSNAVPKLWHEAASESRKPLLSWVGYLRARVQFISGWLSSDDDPACFPISYFFFPQGFLTAVLQQFARARALPIDEMSFQHEVFSNLKD